MRWRDMDTSIHLFISSTGTVLERTVAICSLNFVLLLDFYCPKEWHFFVYMFSKASGSATTSPESTPELKPEHPA